MKKAILLALATLGGCATEPMTDEQRAIALQYLLNRPQPQPVYLPPVQTYQAPAPRICQSNINGQTVTTYCN